MSDVAAGGTGVRFRLLFVVLERLCAAAGGVPFAAETEEMAEKSKVVEMSAGMSFIISSPLASDKHVQGVTRVHITITPSFDPNSPPRMVESHDRSPRGEGSCKG